MDDAPTPTPFKIDVPDSLLDFINQRVASARIPPGIPLPKDKAWSQGIPPSTINHLRTYWQTQYSWRTIEKSLNSTLQQYTLPIHEAGETHTIHFVHHISQSPTAIPLLFQHGWPGSFLEVRKIIDLLTTPLDDSQQAYHVIAPSLPGFAFSSQPQDPDFRIQNMANVNHKLMLALGYERYVVQAGDWGSLVVRLMACTYPTHVLGVHVNMIVGGLPSFWRYPLHLIYLFCWIMYQVFMGEKDSRFNRMLWFRKEESAYQEIQGTKPQTLSYALVDSPVGMLAWIRDKLEYLVDDDFVWEDEEVITMYIIPGTSGHANIYMNMKGSKLELMTADTKIIPKSVPFGVSSFPKDVLHIPRIWANLVAAKNIVYWNEHSKGGHFPSVERPEVLVADIREFCDVAGVKGRIFGVLDIKEGGDGIKRERG